MTRISNACWGQEHAKCFNPLCNDSCHTENFRDGLRAVKAVTILFSAWLG